MAGFIDLSGKKFGRLTVIKAEGKKGVHPCFLCLCDCGNYFVARGDKLRDGRALSCGCLHQEQLKHHEVNTYELDGKVYTTKELLAELGIPATTFYRKLKQGVKIKNMKKISKTPGGDSNETKGNI